MNRITAAAHHVARPSMKVPPKRKGNSSPRTPPHASPSALNESPSEKEGKSSAERSEALLILSLNESPSEKEGKFRGRGWQP